VLEPRQASNSGSSLALLGRPADEKGAVF